MTTSEVAPTPDFYTYDWHDIAAAVVDDRFVAITWSDGVQLRAFDLWLRESAVGLGVDPATREGLLDPASLPETACIERADVSSDGALVVGWADAAEPTTFHPGWLRHVADGDHLASSWLPAPQPWTTSTLLEPPTHDGSTILDSPANLQAYLDDLLRFGIARLRDAPVDLEFGPALGATLGPIRDTNFGDFWDVKAVIDHAGSSDTNSTANTTLRLGPHTDLPTRETPPGFQFLHCLVNDTEGGNSTMADGMAVAAYLEEHHRNHYEALSTLRWVFFNRGKGIDHRWTGPMIDLGVAGSPLTLRAFYPVRAFPAMNDADIPRAYAAMRCFSKLADSDEFKMQYPFAVGDLVGFDNRRILHGREAFSAGGARHLRGFYIDHDDVRSTARVVNRSNHPNRTIPQHNRENS